jgi:formate-dependent nitrite reductase membrane component NrfD
MTPDGPPHGEGLPHDGLARTYYGRPVLKEPVWKWPVPAYFFTGGVAAGTALLTSGARLTGDTTVAHRCLLASLGATLVSGAFLVEDLGRPERFLNMLRIAKPTSPMSVGSWVLAVFGSATGVAAASEILGVARPAGRVAEAVAAAVAPALATYTAVLVADTAVPVWHEARHDLPFVFAGSALASAGGLALLVAPASDTPGRRAALRVAVVGAALELFASKLMERRLGDLGTPYREGRARTLSKLAAAAAAAGAGLAAAVGRRRGAAIAAGALLMAGAAAERFAVFEAGLASARDPRYVVEPQRRRLNAAEAAATRSARRDR